MDDHFKINDLPLKCIKQILSYWITDREHRIYARFVCKLWCALMNEDCSAELYFIDGEEIECNSLCQKNELPIVDFSKIFSIFLNSQQKKTSFRFKCIDFGGSEQFWRTKGAGIISLDFGINCSNIPLSEIMEHCSKLESLTLDTYHVNYKQKLFKMLENCISDGKIKSSIHFLHLKGQGFIYMKDIANFTRLVSQVFIGLRKVSFEEPFLKFHEDNNLFTTAFKNLKFEITLISPCGTFIFDTAGNVPVQTKTSKIIKGSFIYEILTHLSSYSCSHNKLNRLDFHLKNQQNKLDNVQELISQWPLLKSLFIETDDDRFIPLTNPLDLKKNNVDCLALLASNKFQPQLWVIDDAFLQFFVNLRTFICHHTLAFSDFVKVLRELPHLEKLNISGGTFEVDPVQTISNEKLLELKMPYSFLHETITNYNFINLKKLHLWVYMKDLWTLPVVNPCNVDEYLNRMKCPNLEILELEFPINECWKNQDELTQWMLNILALFPRLIKFLFSQDIIISWWVAGKDNYMKAADEILMAILKKHRRLREIGHQSYSHRLKILSPSHFKHYNSRCGSVSVLYIP